MPAFVWRRNNFFGRPYERTSKTRPPPLGAAALRSFGRGHAHAYPQPLARIVVQARDVDVAVVAVFHVVAHEATLLADRADLAAASHRIVILAFTAAGHAVAERAAGHRAGDRGGLAAVTLADRVTEHAADDRA